MNSLARTIYPGAPADAAAWLAAIVDNSHDAILSKTLDGVITSWNAGAERLFGFSHEEAVGRPITIIIPDDRLHEEENIIARLRRGERIDRFETVRRRRDGTAVQIEVTISPVRDAGGMIIGASKIARDISERLRHAETQSLLVREMQHRIKNLLSIVQALISIGRRSAGGVDRFADELSGRVAALASTQQLVLHPPASNDGGETTLGVVLATLLAPYAGARIEIAPCDTPVGESAATSLALIFHELATNSAKYGALAAAQGALHVAIDAGEDVVELLWSEVGGQKPDDTRPGFGTDLIRAALRGLDGTAERAWLGDRLEMRISLARAALAR